MNKHPDAPELAIDAMNRPTTEQTRSEGHAKRIERLEGNIALNDAAPDSPFIATNVMQAAHDRVVEQKKNEERTSFSRQITKLRALIRELDAQREALLQRAAEHAENAQEYFEIADGLDDSLNDMTDGDVTAEDRAKAIARLKAIGIEADGISDAAIIILLQQNRDRINGLGRNEIDAEAQAREEAERIGREIEAAQQLEDAMVVDFDQWEETPIEGKLDRYRAVDDLRDRYHEAQRDVDVLDDGQQNSIASDASIAPTTDSLLEGGFNFG